MAHPLEIQYGLTAYELLDALNKRFRAKVTLEEAVAEVHLEKKIKAAQSQGLITRYEEHDLDGYPDFTIWVKGIETPLKVECKNVRDVDEAYRKEGVIVAYKVEIQKTRTSKGDASTRYYDVNYFDIIAACLGKKTGNWKDFMFAKAADLARHTTYSQKLAVMHRVPLPDSTDIAPWFSNLGDLLNSL